MARSQPTQATLSARPEQESARVTVERDAALELVQKLQQERDAHLEQAKELQQERDAHLKQLGELQQELGQRRTFGTPVTGNKAALSPAS